MTVPLIELERSPDVIPLPSPAGVPNIEQVGRPDATVTWIRPELAPLDPVDAPVENPLELEQAKAAEARVTRLAGLEEKYRWCSEVIGNLEAPNERRERGHAVSVLHDFKVQKALAGLALFESDPEYFHNQHPMASLVLRLPEPRHLKS